jgi:ATP-dependent exoDNAse (exonuclease V) alpha subunit
VVPQQRRSADRHGHNADRVELNERIRQDLLKQGSLRGDEHKSTIFVGRGFAEAQTKNAKSYQAGDVIRFGRGYKSLGVEAGQIMTVKSVDLKRNEVTLQSEGGLKEAQWRPNVEVYRAEQRHLAVGDKIKWTRNERELVRCNGEYAEVMELSPDGKTAMVMKAGSTQLSKLDLETQRNWDHGYDATVHIDTSHCLLTGHESWYFSISRAKDKLTVFTDNADRLLGQISRS